MTYGKFQSMIGSLPRQEVEAIIAKVLAFDREPVSAEVLLKAVRFVAERFGDASEWVSRKTSELVWKICGRPSQFTSKPRIGK